MLFFFFFSNHINICKIKHNSFVLDKSKVCHIKTIISVHSGAAPYHMSNNFYLQIPDF